MPGQTPALTDETDLLLAYIAQQRDGIRFAAYGLTEEQSRRVSTAGALSIGGLVKHVTAMERSWVATMLQRPATSDESSYLDDFALTSDDSLATLLADLDAAAVETEDAVRSVSLDHQVPVPDAPWFPKDVTHWTVRWVLLHLVEEIARHAGHADIVRESIDGATMFELMAGAEGWPATEWLTPWQPPADSAA